MKSKHIRMEKTSSPASSFYRGGGECPGRVRDLSKITQVFQIPAWIFLKTCTVIILWFSRTGGSQNKQTIKNPFQDFSNCLFLCPSPFWGASTTISGAQELSTVSLSCMVSVSGTLGVAYPWFSKVFILHPQGPVFWSQSNSQKAIPADNESMYYPSQTPGNS